MNFAKASLIVISLAFVQVFAESDDEPTEATIEEWTQQCQMETEVDVELLEDEKLDVAIDDSKVKCFYACMMKKIGFMSADGTVDKEKMNNYMPPEVSEERKNRLKETRPICLELTGENECETAFLIRNCIRRRFQIRSGPYDDVPGAYYTKWTKECEVETGANHNLVEVRLRDVQVINPKVKCWHTCMDKKFKFMSADNVVNETRITNFIQYDVRKENREYIKILRARCAKFVGLNECETSYHIFSCLHQAMKVSNNIRETLPNGQKVWTSQSKGKCIEETGADPVLIQAAINNVSTDDRKVQCYFACRYKQEGKMTEDGIINGKKVIDEFLSFLPSLGMKGLVKQPINECIEKIGEDSCDTAFLIHMCVISRIEDIRKINNPRLSVTKRRYAKCAENIDPELLAAEAIDYVARNSEVKCYHSCFYEELKYMNEDGTINKTLMIDRELARFQSNEERVMHEKHITKCVELSGEDKCDTAYLIQKCLDSTIGKTLMEIDADCRNITQVTPELVAAESKGEIPADQNLKCYRACMYEKLGDMSEDGAIIKEKMIRSYLQLIPPKMMNPSLRPLTICAETIGENKCETGFLIYKCMLATMMAFIEASKVV